MHPKYYEVCSVVCQTVSSRLTCIYVILVLDVLDIGFTAKIDEVTDWH